jgi:NTP pyrophosphatase (non-canonical NTP hydrolase)
MNAIQMLNCHEILEHYGIESQRRMLVEECAELIQAVSKVERNGSTTETIRNLFAEIADVEIMLEQVKHHYSEWGTERLIDYKINRQLKRMESEK